MRKRKRGGKLVVLVAFTIAGAAILSLTKVSVVSSGVVQGTDIPDHFRISVDPNQLNDYGLSYPMTYQFSIISGSSNLKAYKKYTEFDEWVKIGERTSSDFFNGEEAARFDYNSNRAYISIAFNESSEEIFLRIVDGSGNPVATYDKITKYYDNRDAAVVFSADDWCGGFLIDSMFQQACDMFTSKKIWLSVAVITEGYEDDYIWGNQPPPIWSNIQEKIDAGYIEVVGHSRTHPMDLPYSDYDSEVGGCKEDIINNLNLPSLYKRGAQEYLWGWTAPHDHSDSSLRSKLGEYKYMSDVAGSFFDQEGDFPSWDSANGLYGIWNRWSYIEWQTVSSLNSEFDRRISAGKIYHIGLHPWALAFYPRSTVDQHTDYVQGRKNLWYVGHGALMIYHYVEDRNIVDVEGEDKMGSLGETYIYPNPCYLSKSEIIEIVNLPLNVDKIYFYTMSGELVRVLEKGNGIEEGVSSARAVWNCENNEGEKVARGIYIYLITTSGGEKKTGKIAFMK